MSKKQKRNFALILTFFMLLYNALSVVSAQAKSGDGNQGGAAVELPGYTMLKFDGNEVKTNSKSKEKLTVTINVYSKKNEPKSFDWSSNIPVHKVYVKAGTGGNWYDFPAGSQGGKGLVAPENKGISHIAFYYKEDPPGDKENPPGDKEDPPGDKEDPPGDKEDPPGDKENPPGDKENPPGDKENPPGDKEDPPGDKENPPGDKEDPPGDKENPPGDKEDPPGDKENPPGDKEDPPGDKENPPGDKEDPPGKGDDNGNSKTNKYKVNFIEGCRPLVESSYFIVKEGVLENGETRLKLDDNGMVTHEKLEVEDILKIGIVFKDGSKQEFNAKDVLVESPKDENGTVIFKVTCEDDGEEQPAPVEKTFNLIIQGCVGLVKQAFLLTDDGKEHEFKNPENLSLVVKDYKLGNITGIKHIPNEGQEKVYALKDLIVAETGDVISITVACDIKPPVDEEEPLLTKIKVVVSGCVGLVEKAALIMKDDKKVEFTSISDLLMELEDVAVEDIKAVELTVKGKVKRYELASLPAGSVVKTDGMITINLKCEVEAEVPKEQFLTLILSSCAGFVDGIKLILSGGEEVELEIDDSGELTYGLEDIRIDDIESIVLIIDGEEEVISIKELLEEGSAVIEGDTLTISFECEDDGGVIIPENPEVPGGPGKPEEPTKPGTPDLPTLPDDGTIIPDNPTPGGNLPKTGEDSPIGFYMAGLLMVITGLGMLRTLRRKHA
ncbi:LPXTG cell wall anchor domain-containing protein [Bacillus sp. B-jedd]|uniref:LPXTG cell wall anchor domain-containing protein n=1 Tax=Bacillus sp. B-jedd TaxID=1476857 RepID=UPI0005156A8E|nr:LPXTG cell wall anchor domain-containing protein [Bacillus sp. B-jedd]CEG29179.1 LPXTG-motif cell wall anchor domain-containing protein [Bacillus sp. B-jedd]